MDTIEASKKEMTKALEIITAEEFSGKKKFLEAAQIYQKLEMLPEAYKEAAKAEKRIYEWIWNPLEDCYDRFNKAITIYRMLGLDYKAQELEKSRDWHRERECDWL